MQLADRCDQAEMTNYGSCGFVRARFGIRPIDVLGVEHCAREPIEELFTVHRAKKAGTALSTSNTWETDSGQLAVQAPGPSISRASRTSARFAALRAASALGFPRASANSSYE